MTHTFGTLDELGDNYGFRKVRVPLGISAFGANAIVYPPGAEGVNHFHDIQDELYFVHSGPARFEVDGEERILGARGLCHLESTPPPEVSHPAHTHPVLPVLPPTPPS